jgi:hypothetical protein
MRSTPPKNVYKTFLENKKIKGSGLEYCPAFKDELKNLYSIQSIYDYEFNLENNSVNSKMYDQNFFNRHVQIRSINSRFFSFSQYFIFFTDQKSLRMSLYPPFLEDNSISSRTTMIPGVFDIGKWFRTIDFAFILNDKYDSFLIKKDKPFIYLKFHTDDKINFKQFRINDKISSYCDDFLNVSKNISSRFYQLENFYKISKNKKNIIKEIKECLV